MIPPTAADAEMLAAAQAYLAIDRASGAPIQCNEYAELVYAVGFAAGAEWALKKIKTEVLRANRGNA